jgi:single-strand DNA-binding protein
MMALNKAILMGNVGKDPELKNLAGGIVVVNFTLATTEKYSRNGKSESKTEWHQIAAFGKLAEICKEYLTKGKKAYIEGKIQTTEWEDKSGNKKSNTQIIATSVVAL